MNPVARAFQEMKEKGKKAVIPYITAGYPDWETTERLLQALPEAGAQLIEVGIPFSDPVADGPVIQQASEAALAKGINLGTILEGLRETPPKVPVVAMGYYNPILRYGVKRFVEDAKAASIGGLIVPDLPPEEAEELIEAARRHNIATIFLVAPTTPKERIATIAKATTGFLYLVSVKGVTGSRLKKIDPILKRMDEIRSVTSLPVCVGFGISTAEEAEAIATHADGIIIGSALIKVLEERGIDGAKRFVEEVVCAVDR